MRRFRTIRYAVALLLGSAVVTVSGCSSSVGTSSNSSPPTPNFTVSYAGATGWLGKLDPTERQEQVRDWARISLAAHLGLDTTRLRNATYDTLPVRDPGFAGLAKQDIGPGRSLYDGQGTLHLLVPRGDPRDPRTIGLLLDQYRTDAGSDAPRTQVHYYQADGAADTIDVSAAGSAEPTSAVRAADGYVTMPVGTAGQLASFLARTSYLSRLELRGSTPVASGWNWPASSDARMTTADVSALQRGYTVTKKAHSQLPGFSLDPQPFLSAKEVLAADPQLTSAQANQVVLDDLTAVIPGLSRDMTRRVINNDWSGSPFKSASDLENTVSSVLTTTLTSNDRSLLSQLGLPTSRVQLMALDSELLGRPSFSQARYEGDLAGTAVGMTLFYTDHVGKSWVTGVGTGIPSAPETGFVPDTTAQTVWSECSGQGSEFGRLWFGENDSAVSSGPNGVSLGMEPVRMYVRSFASGNPNGAEVEPSYSFGRGVQWWDQHYQAIADYDPQYQRLDQIMRWSDALDWLVNKKSAALPRLPDSQIPSQMKFATWYGQHNNLRERSPIDFVSPPQAASFSQGTTQYGESIAPVPSRPFRDCGGIAYKGGVSLSDGSFREGGINYHPDLPSAVSRAGTFDPTSAFHDGTGTGDLRQVAVDGPGKVASFLARHFSQSGTTDTVDVTASGRKVAPFGSLKVWRSPQALRTLSLRMSAIRGQISERVAFQEQDLGELAVRNDVNVVSVQWSPGLTDHVRAIMESIQARRTARQSLGKLNGDLYDYTEPNGQTLYRAGDPGDPWLSVTSQAPPPGDGLAFRGGVPNTDGTGPAYLYGQLVPGPNPHGGWLDVTPAGPDHDAQVTPANTPPGPGDSQVQVTVPGGGVTRVYLHDGHLLVRDNDPVLGLNGPADGAAMLRDFSRIQTAITEAVQAKDEYLRGIDLEGDGVALAGADTVTLLSPNDPWAARVEEAISSQASPMPLFSVQGKQLLPASDLALTPAPGMQASRMSLGEAMALPGPKYLHMAGFRSSLLYEDGPVISSTLPLSTQVTVLKYVAHQAPHLQPDILSYRGAHWVRLTAKPSSGSTPTPAPTPSPGSTPGTAPGSGTPVTLVCPADSSNLPGCGTQ